MRGFLPQVTLNKYPTPCQAEKATFCNSQNNFEFISDAVEVAWCHDLSRLKVAPIA